MAKNINIKMSTMMETLSEMDGVDARRTRSKAAAPPPVHQIGRDRNLSEVDGAKISPTLPPLPTPETRLPENRVCLPRVWALRRIFNGKSDL